ncbi:DUF5131 family protein [Streptomyces canus]|uniref:DUF5131 family protein n=1 Tax=Streptomyces canus TaxID=58343 RepID=UPI0033A2B3A9
MWPGPSRRWHWRHSIICRYPPRGHGLDRDGTVVRGRHCSAGQARARGRAPACGQLERLGSVAAAHVWIGPLLEPVPYLELSPIDRVIAGGESGPAHRPLDLARVRDIRDRCAVNRAGPTAARVGLLVTGRAPPSVTDTGPGALSTQSSPTRQGFRPTRVTRSAKDSADARARLRIRFGRLTAAV